MPYDPDKHHRRSIRLPGYDYAQAGAYFVTICTQGRACVFGVVVDDQMVVNEAGDMVCECWRTIPHHFAGVVLDAFVVMPNHVHGIIMIHGRGERRGEAIASPLPPLHGNPPPHGTQPGSLGAIIQYFKSFSTRFVNQLHRTPGVRIWQRNYYEHVIRNAAALNAIRHYIHTNPLRWARDEENPANISAK